MNGEMPSLPEPIRLRWEREYATIIHRPMTHIPTHILQLGSVEGVAQYWHVTGKDMVDRSEWLAWSPNLDLDCPIVAESLRRYGIDREHLEDERLIWESLELLP